VHDESLHRDPTNATSHPFLASLASFYRSRHDRDPSTAMTLDELRLSLAQAEPSTSLSPLLRALWLDARGDWTGAHHIAQDDDSREGAWVHAFLHRKEGDNGNAAYWYRRASRAPATGGLGDEWEVIARALLTLPER
jgi:hypothetical protein